MAVDVGEPAENLVDYRAHGRIVDYLESSVTGRNNARSMDYPIVIENGAGERLTFAPRVVSNGGVRVEGEALVAPGAFAGSG